MRFGWTAAAGALLAAGCSVTVSGAGRAVTQGATPAPVTTPVPSSSTPAASDTASRPASAPSSGRAPVTSTCPAVFFGVPGSGQGLQHPPPRGVPAGVSASDAHAYGTAVGLVKTVLVKIAGSGLGASHAIDYPATALRNWFGSGGQTTNLDSSEAQGTRALVNAITASEQGSCLGRPVLLAGYSQGAEVVIRAVNALAPEQRVGVVVAMFGNPSYEPGQTGDYPGTVNARGVRPSFTGVGYALPLDVRARTIDICAPGDPVCGMSPAAQTDAERLAYLIRNANTHATAYAFDHPRYATIAAQFLWQHR